MHQISQIYASSRLITKINVCWSHFPSAQCHLPEPFFFGFHIKSLARIISLQHLYHQLKLFSFGFIAKYHFLKSFSFDIYITSQIYFPSAFILLAEIIFLRHSYHQLEPFAFGFISSVSSWCSTINAHKQYHTTQRDYNSYLQSHFHAFKQFTNQSNRGRNKAIHNLSLSSRSLFIFSLFVG